MLVELRDEVVSGLGAIWWLRCLIHERCSIIQALRDVQEHIQQDHEGPAEKPQPEKEGWKDPRGDAGSERRSICQGCQERLERKSRGRHTLSLSRLASIQNIYMRLGQLNGWLRGPIALAAITHEDMQARYACIAAACTRESTRVCAKLSASTADQWSVLDTPAVALQYTNFLAVELHGK